jgi:hypothetical protein
MSLESRIKHLEVAVAKLRKELDGFLKPLSAGKPRQQNDAGIEPGETADQKGNAAPGEAPIAPEVSPPPVHSTQTQKSRYKTLEWWKPRLELIGIFFAIGYAVVTFFQWRDTNRNFRVDERAWVAPFRECIEPPSGVPDPETGCASVGKDDQQVILKVLFKNTGKSFAVNYQVVINPPALDLDATVPPFQRGPVAILAPDQINHVTLPAEPRSWFERVGTNPIYIRGKIWYDDVFGYHHWTEFCYVHIANSMQPGFATCDKYNDCDKCKPNIPKEKPWWKFWQ